MAAPWRDKSINKFRIIKVLVDYPYALFFEAIDLWLKIRGLQGDVVYPLAVLLKKLRDKSFGINGV